ncbi:stress responsive A/B barrel domain-containing protein [Xylariaceae sp. FL0662B]|nr:stress responsive A/B barrel domain-containing protein [Xylariaceae sp. FL0662B]
MPVNHIVLFQFKADASPQAVAQTCASILALKETCLHPQTQKPYIKSLTGGRDNSKEGRQNGIQWAFVVEFDNLDDRDFYVSTDKAHADFKAGARPIIEKSIVVDYSF